MSFITRGVASYWRPHEHEAILKYFGDEAASAKEANYLFWRLNTEAVTAKEFAKAEMMEQEFKGKIINPIRSYKYTNNKDQCFAKWQKAKVRIPKYFTYEDLEDFKRQNRFGFPYIIRLNDQSTGKDSFLIENQQDFDHYFPQLEKTYRKKKRLDTKKLCVEFIDTRITKHYHVAFRITVAGNKVVSGYARVSRSWLAFTKEFTPEMKRHFIQQNIRVKQIIDKHEKEIVRAVRALSLHHVGVDVIIDQKGKLYFLEVQPFYFAGNLQKDQPPFWNPSYSDLRNWLIKSRHRLYQKIPYYYDRWLNKHEHFDLCYKNLWEFFHL